MLENLQLLQTSITQRKQENRTALVKMSQPGPYAEIYMKFAKRAPQRKKRSSRVYQRT